MADPLDDEDSVLASVRALEASENRLRDALTEPCPACDLPIPVGGMRRHLAESHSGGPDA